MSNILDKLESHLNEWEARGKFKQLDRAVKAPIENKEKELSRRITSLSKFKADIDYCIGQSEKFISKMEAIAVKAGGMLETEPYFEIHNSFFYTYVSLSVPRDMVDSVYSRCETVGKIRKGNLSVKDTSEKSAKHSAITMFISFNITPTKTMD